MSTFFDFLLGLTVLVGTLAMGVYLFIRALKRSDDPLRLISRWLITLLMFPVIVMAIRAGPFAPIIAAAAAIVIGITWAPSWAAILVKPLTNALDGGLESEEKPLYSIAEAKRKRGQYHEAVAAIQDELARFPNDFTGQMLMAEIQYLNLKDLPSAQTTIEVCVAQENHPEKNVVYALNRLADWQMQAGQDDAARGTLELLTQRYPGTEHAFLASQRLAHLNPALREQRQQSRRIEVTRHEGNLLTRRQAGEAAPPAQDLEARTARLIDQLEAYPADNEAREELALIYAHEYGQLDVALDQLEQLISQPGVPARRVVHWLNLMADLHIVEAEDVGAARQALQRIVDLDPTAPEAEQARQRMLYLKLDAKGQRPGASVGMTEFPKLTGPPKSIPRIDPKFLPDFLRDRSTGGG